MRSQYLRHILIGVTVCLSAVGSHLLEAGFPPTTSRDSSDTTDVTTFLFRFPNFTGVHTGTIFTLGVNSIAGGGTGQTTANAALNALLPSQASNAGKTLLTDGTNASWQPATGTGTVTSVSSGDGSLDITSPTTTPDIRIHFPMNAALGTNTAPSIRFDSDTGMYSTGDGDLAFTTNGVKQLQLGVGISSNVFTNSVTAPNFIYPSQAQNSVLAGPASGGAGVPSFRALALGDIPNSALSFPITAPLGSLSAPSFRFDSDTGILSTGDGNLTFATNLTANLTLDPGTAVFSGTVAATNFIYPSQTQHTFLAAPAGSAGVPSFRLIAPGDITNGDIPYPLFAPQNVSFLGTGYCFDSDTCMDSSGDGEIDISANAVQTLTITPSVVAVTGNLTVSGNISAANYPPSDTANTLAQFNNSGVLSASPWAIDPDNFNLTNIWSISSGDSRGTYDQLRMQTNLAGTITGVARSLNLNLSGGANPIQSIEGINMGINSDTVDQLNIADFSSNGAVGNNGYGITVALDGATTNNSTALDLRLSSTVGGSSTLINATDHSNSTGGSNLVNLNSDGTAGNGRNIINAYNNGAVTGDYRGLQLGNDGTVSNFSAGVLVNQGGDVTKGFTGYGSYFNGNGGDGSESTIMYDSSTSSGKTINSNLFGFNFFNNASFLQGMAGVSINNQANYTGDLNFFTGFNQGAMTGNNTVRGLAIFNASGGTGYRFNGINISNQANQTEEIQGIHFDTTGSSRTSTALDITMNGNATDDAQAVRVNVSGQTSTNQHVRSASFEGGLFGVQGDFTPFSSAAVEIGNNFTSTATIQSGSPLTGTDQIIQLIQSNLLVQDDIATGPFGLDTNMVGMASQIAVDSGKTVPMVRSLLLGTTVPQGSGGTLTEHVVLELLGLPSFGGSVSNPTRTGIRDSQLIGANFCDGTTTCHFLDVRDGNAQNSFAGGVQLKTSGSQPTCDLQHRGTFWNIEGGTGVADILQICQKDATDTYVWVTK